MGLLNALYAVRAILRDPALFPHRACQIEIDVLGRTLSKEDQYATTFGGVDYIEFHVDDTLMRRDWEQLGELVDEGWRSKRGLSAGINRDRIERQYTAAKAAGAYDGKISEQEQAGSCCSFIPPSGLVKYQGPSLRRCGGRCGSRRKGRGSSS